MSEKNVQSPDAPEDSDFFEGDRLGLQWQWNANDRQDWYSLQDNYLSLYAQKKESGLPLCDVPNLLLQKWPAPDFSVTVHLCLGAMRDGDVCGMVSLGERYDSMLVCRKKGRKFLQQRTGKISVGGESETELGEIDSDALCLRMKVEKADRISWEAGITEDKLQPIGAVTQAAPGVWVGVKAGLVAMHEGEGECGQMDVKDFVYGRIMESEYAEYSRL